MLDFLLKSANSFIFFNVPLRPFLKGHEKLNFFYIFVFLSPAFYYSQPSTITVSVFTCLYLLVNSKRVTMLDALNTLAWSARWLLGFIPVRINSVLLTRNYISKDTFWFHCINLIKWEHKELWVSLLCYLPLIAASSNEKLVLCLKRNYSDQNR